MYDLHHDLLDALKATPAILTSLLEEISQQQARAARGGDENWSVVEVVCHLRDAEEISLQRMQAMRDQENPQILGYDQEALARERNYRDQELRSALAGFIAFRIKYVSALSALKPEEWERPGQHNEIGQITILAHTIHHACHDAIHCAQVARQLGKNS
jgi:uncharacterized damage-inducible protein DinB